MALFLVTPAASEAVTLPEAKKQVRRTDLTDDDDLLQNVLIPAVRERCELATRRQLLTATWDWKLDAFPCSSEEALEIPLPPLLSVTSISYVDPDGATQTWSSADYLVSKPVGPRAARGRVTPIYGGIYPSTRAQVDAVTVRFVAGYGTSTTSIPAQLRMAMLLDLGTLYENREDMIVGQGYVITPFPTGSKQIYQSYRS
jgi:uncharacterized phiE125 gp8 family phage protein